MLEFFLLFVVATLFIGYVISICVQELQYREIEELRDNIAQDRIRISKLERAMYEWGQ